MPIDDLRRWWRRVRHHDAPIEHDDIHRLEVRADESELRIQALEESVRLLEIRHGLYRSREAS